MHRLLGWYAEFLLKIIFQFLLGKTSARLNLKIMLNSLHIGPDKPNLRLQIGSKSVLYFDFRDTLSE